MGFRLLKFLAPSSLNSRAKSVCTTIPGVTWRVTGRLQSGLLFYLYQAYRARADRFECRMVTERWDVDPGCLRRFEDSLSRLSDDLQTIDGDVHRCHSWGSFC
jgi:hypothetical protein